MSHDGTHDHEAGPEHAPEQGPLPGHLDLWVPDAELSPTELGWRRHRLRLRPSTTTSAAGATSSQAACSG